MQKSKRKKIATDIETQVLYSSRRRCLFCFGLRGDFRTKRGQIAHIDHNSSNSALENLAFLCMPHHDEYDSRTSQSKSLTKDELRKYLTVLTQFILDGGVMYATDVTSRQPKKIGTNHPISLDLYDRRIKFYESAKALIGLIVQNADIKTADCLKFAHECDQALFYFNNEVVAYFRELYIKAIQISRQNHSIRDSPMSDDERRDLIHMNNETMMWFIRQYDPLQSLMQPFLYLG